VQLILYQKKGPVAHIILNRPAVLNALNELMISEIKLVLETIESDDEIKVIVLAGSGKAFSAGVDLKTTKPESFLNGGEFMEMGLEIRDILSNSNKVTIAQIHGYCFTGAMELMLFFDMAFCTEETQFGDTHAKWAILPRWGMSQNLARRVGLIKAKELSFRAMRIRGVEAERIGLVNRAFPADTFEADVNAIIAEIIGNSFEAIAKIKKLYNDGFETTLKEGLQIEYNTDAKLKDTGSKLSQFEKKKFSD